MGEIRILGDAVLVDITNPEELYFTHEGTQILVSMEAEFMFQSKGIDPKLLDNGTRGNLYWDDTQGRCTRVEITVKREKRSAEEEFTELARVFLRHRHPTKVLKVQYSSAKEVALIDVIASVFPALRKVASNASFWIAFGTAFLEHLARANDPEQVQAFLHLVSSASTNSPVFREFGELPPDQLLEWIESKCKDDGSFGIALADTIRKLILYYVQQHDTELEFGYNSVDEMRAELYKDLHRMSDADFYYLSRLLNVHLTIIFLYGDTWKRSIKVDSDKTKRQPRLYLLDQGGYFSILYSKAQLDAEGYDLTTYSRRKEKRQQLNQYLYKEQRLPIQLQSENWEQELAAQRESTKLLSDVVGAVHNFIKVALTAIDKWRLLLDIPFFTNEAKIAFCTGYDALLKSFEKQKDKEVNQIQTQVMTIPDLMTLFKDTLRLCGKCGKEPGEVNLGCHKIGRVCFEQCEQEQLEHFFTSTSMPCPLVSCSRAIPLEVFKKAVDTKNFQGAETLWLESNRLLRCSVCHLPLQYNLVYDLECGCKLCLFCLANILRSSYHCPCHLPIPEQILNYMRSFDIKCEICGVARNLVRHFPPVKCRDHSICKMCWRNLIREPAPQCPSCHYLFTSKEQEQATVTMQEICLKCKQPGSDMLETTCLCTICKPCTIKLIQDIEPWQCPCCKLGTTEQSAMEYIFRCKKKQSFNIRRP